MRLILSDQNFIDLVAGDVTNAQAWDGSKHVPVEIMLQDIGWQRMHKIIHDMIMKADRPTLEQKL